MFTNSYKRFCVVGVMLLLLASCVTVSKDSPEIQKALKDSRGAINDCLIDQLFKLAPVYPDPNIITEVAAARCQATAYQEVIKLRKLNTSKAYIAGYTSGMTDVRELQSQAMNILMLLLEEKES